MPRINANGFAINYQQQGAGDPLVLIPYLAADHACYAFQVAEYAKHFTCISLDLRGTGETDKPDAAYTTETLADDVAAFMQAIGVGKARIAGLSLGAAVGLWLAVKHPNVSICPDCYTFWPGGQLYQQNIEMLQDQFVYGSAFPFGNIDTSLEMTRKLPLSEGVMHKYLYGNAAALLKL